MDGNNTGDGGGGVEAAMNMRMRGWKKKEEIRRKKKKIGKKEKKENEEDEEDGAAVSGRKWNRKEKKNLFINLFLWLRQKHKCNGPKLNKTGLKCFKRNGSWIDFVGLQLVIIPKY